MPGHLFLPGNDAAHELARRGALLVPSVVPCSISSLISRIHFCFFSDWRRIVSFKFFDTQVPSISTKELMLFRHARCVLSPPCCNGHSLLLSSYFTRTSRIENPSCNACGHPSQDIFHPHSGLSSYGLFAPLALWRLFVSTISGTGRGELSGFWISMVLRHAPSLGRGRVTTTTTDLHCSFYN